MASRLAIIIDEMRSALAKPELQRECLHSARNLSKMEVRDA
jgi:hypothetical protein